MYVSEICQKSRKEILKLVQVFELVISNFLKLNKM